ncbi:hypothetical protein MKW92_040078 [Papaver armeniacum]|nr:hypothetical protein MKW92_040078 [Papaver armeniacum]
MAGSNGGGGNAGGRRGRTRSRAADRHAHVDDEENVYRDLGDLVDVDPNPPPLVHENVSAEIGGNFVNPADPNVSPQQIPAALGGSEAAAPIGEGESV